MKPFLFISCILAFFITHAQKQEKHIEGIVFIDKNSNTLFDAGDTVLPDILVSNGRDIVTTNKKGRYKIKTILHNPVFIIKPTGYISKIDSLNKVLFYKDSEKEEQNFYFPLYPHQEKDSLKIALLGDIQVDVMDDIFHTGKLVTEELVENKPDFIVPLGDLSFDNPEIFQPLSQTLGLIGSPVFYVIGNHDLNFGETTLECRDQNFEKNFGPSYYAFEYSSNLFLVLNNVYPANKKYYEGKIDQNQLTFIKNLTQNKSNQYKAIKVFMHIPLNELANKDKLIAALNPFEEIFIASGHTHTQYHEYHKRNGLSDIHELVGGAVCGSWWQGPHDIRGIPFALMYDGTPKGYWIMNIQKDKYHLTYKVSGAPYTKQMNIWVPEVNQWDTALNILNEPYVYANVFAADKNTEVMISFEDDSWLPMEKHEGISPELMQFYTLQELGRYKSQKLSQIPQPKTISKHLWRIKIPEHLGKGAHLIKIEAQSENLHLNVSGHRVLWIN
ncbi:calcineurin-like phosphoesterase C-terminal domain-containing protein [Abyssalbus ytuae]|uniref:Calcineurin-like phosphoesterase family protein n=1 Tax=Abyssalbus ytuae TaxID=2926907 RepID=A0A9E6ZU19_9FLAO|nr:calcineurin-like phosphoesterase family protein [Abyssalbus ytuae]UOB16711.1 calcineurin-like phosphoesterase family protein [Abyssalbus ytuae]